MTFSNKKSIICKERSCPHNKNKECTENLNPQKVLDSVENPTAKERDGLLLESAVAEAHKRLEQNVVSNFDDDLSLCWKDAQGLLPDHSINRTAIEDKNLSSHYRKSKNLVRREINSRFANLAPDANKMLIISTLEGFSSNAYKEIDADRVLTVGFKVTDANWQQTVEVLMLKLTLYYGILHRVQHLVFTTPRLWTALDTTIPQKDEGTFETVPKKPESGANVGDSPPKPQSTATPIQFLKNCAFLFPFWGRGC